MRSKFLISIIILGWIAVHASGCTTNPYTGERQVSKTAVGAGIGAGIGTLAGGAVGAYMDYQED